MFSLETAERYLCAFKQNASYFVSKKKYNKALGYINAAAYTAYSLCLCYRDEELESLLIQISNNVNPHAFSIKKERAVVFYDMFSRDHSGLTQQYLGALISNQYNVLYLHENDLSISSATLLNNTINHYKNIETRRVPRRLSGIDKSQWIYNQICEYGAEKLLMHLYPQSAIECVAFYALPKAISRYQINITDHSFWLGAGCTDYSFEFRQFGCAVSKKERGIAENKQILLPYYPVLDEVAFQGFPAVVDSKKVIFFTGGHYYKVLGENHIFFTLCKQILDKCKDSVILFAGIGDDSTVVDLLNNLNITDRFILLGFRHDILEVFRHSDIYINTYPIDGGLMSQFAAHCSLPILNYSNDRIEEIVCQKKKVSFTSYTEEDFIREAVYLYEDESYRKSKGSLINSCVLSINEFNKAFNEAITFNQSPFRIEIEKVDLKMKYDVQGRLNYINKTKAFDHNNSL